MVHRHSVIVFAPSLTGKAAVVAQIIDSGMFPGVGAVVFTDVALVRAELKTAVHGPALAVLLAADRGELRMMVELLPWFEAVTVVVMVPDYHRRTIALAHRLRPRFVAWPGISRLELRMVLHHIIARVVHGPLVSEGGPVLLPGFGGHDRFTLIPRRRQPQPGMVSMSGSASGFFFESG